MTQLRSSGRALCLLCACTACPEQEEDGFRHHLVLGPLSSYLVQLLLPVSSFGSAGGCGWLPTQPHACCLLVSTISSYCSSTEEAVSKTGGQGGQSLAGALQPPGGALQPWLEPAQDSVWGCCCSELRHSPGTAPLWAGRAVGSLQAAAATALSCSELEPGWPWCLLTRWGVGVSCSVGLCPWGVAAGCPLPGRAALPAAAAACTSSPVAISSVHSVFPSLGGRCQMCILSACFEVGCCEQGQYTARD